MISEETARKLARLAELASAPPGAAPSCHWEGSPMPDIDEIQTVGAVAEMLRRVVREKRVELLRDEETDMRVALVPWELLLELADAGGPPMAELRGCLRELASQEREARRETGESVQSPQPHRNGEP